MSGWRNGEKVGGSGKGKRGEGARYGAGLGSVRPKFSASKSKENGGLKCGGNMKRKRRQAGKMGGTWRGVGGRREERKLGRMGFALVTR